MAHQWPINGMNIASLIDPPHHSSKGTDTPGRRGKVDPGSFKYPDRGVSGGNAGNPGETFVAWNRQRDVSFRCFPPRVSRWNRTIHSAFKTSAKTRVIFRSKRFLDFSCSCTLMCKARICPNSMSKASPNSCRLHQSLSSRFPQILTPKAPRNRFRYESQMHAALLYTCFFLV